MEYNMSEIEITSKTPEEFESEGENIVVYKSLAGMVAGIAKSSVDLGLGNNPWTAEDVDKFATKKVTKEYRNVVRACRFFYRRDPFASVIINKMVDIAMSELQLIQGNVPDNQFRVYESFLDELQDFSEDCALEYLISGLLLPEIELERKPKRELQKRGIKAYSSLFLPESFWIRDPATIIINSPLLGSKPSYYVEVPDELIHFITQKGVYPDGTEDKELYTQLARLYPDFVALVDKGETRIKLEVDLAFRRRVLTDSPYPTPFLYPALESLRHKRNLRRMDYSLASRVITAIQIVRVGNDTYPLVSEDDQQLEVLRTQMRWKDSQNKEIERIFQLFTNHTVEIEWILPDVSALLDEAKYKSVNADILNSFGFPKILVTGETERSQSSDASIAMVSPEKTLEGVRRKVIRVLRKIIFDVADQNGFAKIPEIRFSPMNLRSFSEFLEGLILLYETGNLSRTDLDKALGFDFMEQIEKRADEISIIEELGIPEFAPVPHSNSPNSEDENTTETKENEEK
jgi:hypothetical protein